MNDERQRPYYDPPSRQPCNIERALVVVPECEQGENVATWIYNWLTHQFERYEGQKKPQ